MRCSIHQTSRCDVDHVTRGRPPLNEGSDDEGEGGSNHQGSLPRQPHGPYAEFFFAAGVLEAIQVNQALVFLDFARVIGHLFFVRARANPKMGK